LADIGGLAGMLLGMSILSFYDFVAKEIAKWFKKFHTTKSKIYLA